VILKKYLPEPVLAFLKVKDSKSPWMVSMIFSQSDFSLQAILVKMVFPLREAKVNL
jgi:hypothetical protein